MKKLTTNITDEAAIAIRSAAASTGVSEIDTVSRALSMYAILMVANIGQPIEMIDRGGGPSITVAVLDRQGMPD